MIFTISKIIINSLMERRCQLRHGFSLIIDKVIYSFDLAEENPVRLAVCDRADIPFIL